LKTLQTQASDLFRPDMRTLRRLIQVVAIIAVFVRPIVAQPLGVASQSPAAKKAEAGLPILRNYPPKEYRGQPQIWSIVQDAKGVLYFSGQGGFISFDGSAWRRYNRTDRFAYRRPAIATLLRSAHCMEPQVPCCQLH